MLRQLCQRVLNGMWMADYFGGDIHLMESECIVKLMMV